MNYYQILQINQQATQEEIKQAYRRLAKQFHPDSQTKKSNHEQIVLINAAYEILSETRKRSLYDQELFGESNVFIKRRQQKSQTASNYYSQSRQNRKQVQDDEFSWIKEVYLPVNRFLNLILMPLQIEINYLSADPFDDRLMLVFNKYLNNCINYFEQARNILMSKPNPSKYANLAANLYYCLNHISDGIEELQRFTQTYDEYYLHIGKELFNLAENLKIESQHIANKLT